MPPALELSHDRVGDRFDSQLGTYRVIYFGTNREACYAETLSRFRADPSLPDFAEEWDRLGFMLPGNIPRDWRTRRTLVRVKVDGPGQGFLDVEDLQTRTYLWSHLADEIRAVDPAYQDLQGLDVPLIRGPDRRITRLISQWVFSQFTGSTPTYSGIRYLSRIDSRFECWTVFDGAQLTITGQWPVLSDDPGLRHVAGLLGLTVH